MEAHENFSSPHNFLKYSSVLSYTFYEMNLTHSSIVKWGLFGVDEGNKIKTSIVLKFLK